MIGEKEVCCGTAVEDSLARKRSEYDSTSDTLIIAEWDDVIFPRTWSRFLLKNVDGVMYLAMDKESWTTMSHIAMTAGALLSVACAVGNVHLVCKSKKRMVGNLRRLA